MGRARKRIDGYVVEPLVQRTPSTVMVAAVKQLRPKQWFKNIFLIPDDGWKYMSSGVYTTPVDELEDLDAQNFW